MTNLSDTGSGTVNHARPEDLVNVWNDDTGGTFKPGYPVVSTCAAAGSWYGAVGRFVLAADQEDYLRSHYPLGVAIENPSKDIDTAIVTGESFTVGIRGDFLCHVPSGNDIIGGKAIRYVTDGVSRYPDTGGKYPSCGYAMETATGESWAHCKIFGGQ